MGRKSKSKNSAAAANPVVSAATASAARCLDPDSLKTTPGMKSALQELQLSLMCPLCGQVLKEASTLGCAHTFCKVCIEQYSCNNWHCPLPGCGLPITTSKKYKQINPALQSVVDSFQGICQALEQYADDEWWLKGKGTEVTRNMEEDSDEESEDEDYY